MSNDSKGQQKVQLGGLLADFLTSVFGDVRGLEGQLQALRQGNLEKSTVKGIVDYLRDRDPQFKLRAAVGRYVQQGAAGEIDQYLSLGDYDKVIKALSSHLTAGDLRMVEQNPFYDDPATVAKRLTGAPLVLTSSPGSIQAGIITSVWPYDEGGYDAGLVMPEHGPGTLGRWVASRRGGYAIPTVEAHEPGKRGYVALASATIGSEKLGMTELTRRLELGGPDKNDNGRLYGKSLLTPHLELRIIPHDRNFDSLPDTVRVNYSKSQKKGPGSLGVCELETK